MTKSQLVIGRCIEKRRQALDDRQFFLFEMKHDFCDQIGSGLAEPGPLVGARNPSKKLTAEQANQPCLGLDGPVLAR